MVRDYTQQYYGPATRAGAAAISDDYAGAKAMADYRRRVDAAWPAVTVTDVEADGLPDTPVLGSTLTLSATVGLGGLGPSDVSVQAVFGHVDQDEQLGDVVTVPMLHQGSAAGGERFLADTTLPLSGSVGYTVRVLPHHPLLAGDAELGRVAGPSPM
jgi:starch phosphorylase